MDVHSGRSHRFIWTVMFRVLFILLLCPSDHWCSSVASGSRFGAELEHRLINLHSQLLPETQESCPDIKNGLYIRSNIIHIQYVMFSLAYLNFMAHFVDWTLYTLSCPQSSCSVLFCSQREHFFFIVMETLHGKKWMWERWVSSMLSLLSSAWLVHAYCEFLYFMVC